ncbi:transposase [Acidovorax temperans]|uniref:transposase n=1 Tax=Acidovorax temperans TaxID=80878 RepID=UPI001150A2AB|nr:transposase [Acidovorax temperans]
MSQEIPHSRSCVPRTRRAYSAQFKAELIAACQQPGASIAATAREHGMNANVLPCRICNQIQVPARFVRLGLR